MPGYIVWEGGQSGKKLWGEGGPRLVTEVLACYVQVLLKGVDEPCKSKQGNDGLR